ncbi:MAG: DUF202 domain-containing protein, partial [Propionibacteriaceae bacterium]
AERTRLAWSRTALSFAAVGALLLHIGTSPGHRLQELPGLLALCSAAATYLPGVGRYHAAHRNVLREQPMTSAGSVRTLAGLTTLTAVLVLILIIT